MRNPPTSVAVALKVIRFALKLRITAERTMPI